MDYASLEAEERYRGTDCNQRRSPVKSAFKAVRPKHVIAEEQRQVKDHANYSRCDSG